MGKSGYRVLGGIVATAVVLATASVSAAAGNAASQPADRYIVTTTTQQSVTEVANRLPGSVGIQTRLRGKAFNGLVVEATASVAKTLRQIPGVTNVEKDGIVQASDTSSWGIDRIDQRDLPLDGANTSPLKGAGTHIYVVDTGITETAILTGRVGAGANFVKGRNITTDCNGHGTHVAGTAAGSDGYGVAPGAIVHPVRVLDCNGSGRISGVISGLNWISDNAPAASVANASLGGGRSSSLDSAVSGLVASGTPIAVAAGNSDADACDFSPAAAPDALTTGATTSGDVRSSFSNFGPCVDVFAPGSGITSMTPGDSVQTWNGTSMASPHVAGAVAAFLGVHPAASASSVNAWVSEQATAGRLSDGGLGSPNLLLYVADNAGDLDTTPPGPVTGLAVTSVGQSTIQLSWNIPADLDLAQVVVRRAEGSTAPSAPWKGTDVPLDDLLATSATDSGLKSGTVYSYAVFTVDVAGNVATPGQVISATTEAGTDGGGKGGGPKAKRN
ncbi:MAG: S8 family serine peptidase [Candidatus Nanopelagicales bacterium]|nr:S8 family serine peptidase [Candidatus Nanopelagicales bacterium]